MKTKAAVLWELGKNWEVAELDLDPPKQGEVLIRYVAAGLCHSDEHLRHGDIVPRFPLVGGHEGAGIIEEVGPGGVEGDGLSFAPVVSAEGAMVVFSSEATNLVPEDSNGMRDVFVASTTSGVVSRLSRGSGNKGGDGPSLGPVLDASGAMVAFTSFATNLVPGDTNGQSDVFVAPSPALQPNAGAGRKRAHR